MGLGEQHFTGEGIEECVKLIDVLAVTSIITVQFLMEIRYYKKPQSQKISYYYHPALGFYIQF